MGRWAVQGVWCFNSAGCVPALSGSYSLSLYCVDICTDLTRRQPDPGIAGCIPHLLFSIIMGEQESYTWGPEVERVMKEKVTRRRVTEQHTRTRICPWNAHISRTPFRWTTQGLMDGFTQGNIHRWGVNGAHVFCLILYFVLNNVDSRAGNRLRFRFRFLSVDQPLPRSNWWVILPL